MRDLARNLSDLTVALSQHDILLCSETLVSDMHHVSEVLFPVLVSLSCCVGARCLGPMGLLHTFEMVMKHFANQNLSVKCEMLVFMVCDVRQNLYVYSHYRNPDLDDCIFYCLHASMATVEAEDVRASFLFVGNLNGHHQEWLGSMTMISHGMCLL